MRAPEVIYNIPEDLEYIWITNLPNFTIEKYKVESITTANNGDKLIKVIDSPIWGNAIKARFNSNGDKEWYLIKRSYHLTEISAALRLRDHFRKMLAENVNPTTKRVLNDTKDTDLMMKNVEKFVENYPELTI